MEQQQETMQYKFESDYFGLTEDSFHFLRNGFSYKNYKIDEVNQIAVEKGKLVNNWLIILILGIGLVGFSVYYSYRLYNLLTSDQIVRIYIEQIVVPVIPLFLGVYCLYMSLKNGPILRATFKDNKRKQFPLDKVAKNNGLDLLLSTLKNLEGLKNKTTIRI